LSFLEKCKNKKNFSLGIIKIIIISLVSVYFIGGFVPFYQEARDDYMYGIGAIDIVNGNYEYTNEFLKNTEYEEFSFGTTIKTINQTLIPNGAIGLFGLAAFSYLLGGYLGLFYLGPISTILLLIISERVITKLFGSFAGLAVLIFLSMKANVLFVGNLLLTDSIFSLLLFLGAFFLIKFLKDKTCTSILLCSSFLTAATFFRFMGVIFLPIEILIISGYFLFHYIKNRKQDVGVKSSSNLDLNLIKHLSKIEIKKILKFALHILGPWLVFFIFVFSFNSYFFGDPFTTYLEQKRGIETGNIISSYFQFDSERFGSIEEYFADFLPSKTYNIIKMATLSSVLLDQFLHSIISFSFLFSALIISLYFKIHRSAIIVFTSFIFGMLLFYSSNEVISLTEVELRYMIPIFPFFFGILGYLMYRAWKINYQKISFKYYPLISKSWKGFLIIIFGAFLLASFYDSKPVDSIIVKQNFEFKNPLEFADRYPLDNEGLTEKDVLILGRAGAIIWEYNAIPFNPFGGYNETLGSKGKPWYQHSIMVMNKLFDDGYDFYIFKIKNRGDPSYYKYLEDEHGLILKEHSETFCKLIRIENASAVNNIQILSDDICHTFLNTRLKVLPPGL